MDNVNAVPDQMYGRVFRPIRCKTSSNKEIWLYMQCMVCDHIEGICQVTPAWLAQTVHNSIICKKCHMYELDIMVNWIKMSARANWNETFAEQFWLNPVQYIFDHLLVYYVPNLLFLYEYVINESNALGFQPSSNETRYKKDRKRQVLAKLQTSHNDGALKVVLNVGEITKILPGNSPYLHWTDDVQVDPMFAGGLMRIFGTPNKNAWQTYNLYKCLPQALGTYNPIRNGIEPTRLAVITAATTGTSVTLQVGGPIVHDELPWEDFADSRDDPDFVPTRHPKTKTELAWLLDIIRRRQQKTTYQDFNNCDFILYGLPAGTYDELERSLKNPLLYKKFSRFLDVNPLLTGGTEKQKATTGDSFNCPAFNDVDDVLSHGTKFVGGGRAPAFGTPEFNNAGMVIPPTFTVPTGVSSTTPVANILSSNASPKEEESKKKKVIKDKKKKRHSTNQKKKKRVVSDDDDEDSEDEEESEEEESENEKPKKKKKKV